MNNKLKWGSGISAAALAIIAAVLNVEGGYVNNPKDPGGETNHGITKAVAVENGYVGSMKDLPKDFAKGIYYEDYIVKPGFLPLVEANPAVGHKIVDIGVNTGTTRPSRWFQASLNSLNNSGKLYPKIAEDGKVGPGTVAAYKSLEKARGKVKACELTIKLLDSYQAQYYISLNNPTFTSGWIDNRIGNVPIERCKEYATTTK